MRAIGTMAAAGAALAAAAAAADEAPYTCGGIGMAAEAEAEAVGYAFKLIYADDEGRYLGDTYTVVRRGDTVMFEAACAGPWVLMRLPPGAYTAEATFEGETRELPFTVEAETTREAVVTF